MDNFLPFFLILFASVGFSTLFTRIHIPWVVALITAGIAIGPQGFGILEIDDTLRFIGEVGLIFLMFMAGLETRLSNIKNFQKAILPLSFMNGAVPFAIGFFIGMVFGYSLTISLLIGIIFVSSSIAIVIPTLESNDILKTRLGQSIMATSVIQDVASLVLLSLFLQTSNQVANLPLLLFYPILILQLVLARHFIPKIEKFFAKSGNDRFQSELRAVFLVLFGTVLLFQALGLHTIIAAFFAGFALSDTVTSDDIKGKIHAIAYGVFIPTFFVIIGLETDILSLIRLETALPLVLAIVIGSVLSKFLSGYFGSLLVGFNSDQSLLFGASSVPQLSTTLAATFAAQNLGIIGNQLATAMVILSIVTTLFGPALMGIFVDEVITPRDLNKKAI